MGLFLSLLVLVLVLALAMLAMLRPVSVTASFKSLATLLILVALMVFTVDARSIKLTAP